MSAGPTADASEFQGFRYGYWESPVYWFYFIEKGS